MLREFSKKQLEFFNQSNARINLVEGSVRSGKSFILLLRFMKELKEGPEGSYLICGKSERTVLHNIINPLLELTGGVFRYNRGLGEFTLLGKRVYVVGANDERAEQKIRGSTFAGALVDEVSIIPQGFFRMLLSRLSVEGSKLFGSTNPDSPYHWLKADFIDRSSELDMKVFKFVLEDNPSLTESYLKAIRNEYKGLWYKRFILGEWVMAEGAVFDFFDESLHVVKSPPSYAKYYLLGVDYGTTNPFAATLIGYNDDVHPTLWVEKEYYWDSKANGMQRTDAEYADDLAREFENYPVKLVYLDPAAASFEVELKRKRWPVRQAKNMVLDGVRFVSMLLTGGDLVIHEDCNNLIREIEGYVWDSKSGMMGLDRPVKARDHAIDAMRYAIFSHYGHLTTLKETTKEQRHQRSDAARWNRNPMAYPGFQGSHGWQVI